MDVVKLTRTLLHLRAVVADIKKLNQDLNNIEGVIGTSLFVDEVTKIIISGESGVRIVSR